MSSNTMIADKSIGGSSTVDDLTRAIRSAQEGVQFSTMEIHVAATVPNDDATALVLTTHSTNIVGQGAISSVSMTKQDAIAFAAMLMNQIAELA